jgi:hypothetical protein
MAYFAPFSVHFGPMVGLRRTGVDGQSVCYELLEGMQLLRVQAENHPGIGSEAARYMSN